MHGPQPTLTVDDPRGYQIMVDGQALLQSKTRVFSVAVHAWFDAFWVFNIAYPKKLERTLTFLEYFVIGHKVTKLVKSLKLVQTVAKRLKLT